MHAYEIHSNIELLKIITAVIGNIYEHFLSILSPLHSYVSFKVLIQSVDSSFSLICSLESIESLLLSDKIHFFANDQNLLFSF